MEGSQRHVELQPVPSALAADYVDSSVMPQLDHYVSLAWEEISRQYVLRSHSAVTAIGRWWGPVPAPGDRRTEEREIDVAGLDNNGSLAAAGMCKWTSTKVDFDELNLLDRLREHIPGNGLETHRYLFSRSGFTSRVIEYASSDALLTLVTPADIYR